MMFRMRLTPRSRGLSEHRGIFLRRVLYRSPHARVGIRYVRTYAYPIQLVYFRTEGKDLLARFDEEPELSSI